MEGDLFAVKHFTFQRSDTSEKIIQAAVLVGCLGSAVLGSILESDSSGIGTHTKLGLPPCGFYTVTGIPCPTCGVTTSFVEAAHGRFAKSFFTQPLGLFTFAGICAGAVVLTAALVSGKSLFKLKLPLGAYTIMTMILVTVVLSWIYKIYVCLQR